LQIGGAADFATIANVRGQFKITIYFTATGGSNSGATVAIKDSSGTTLATSSEQTNGTTKKEFVWTYTGTDTATYTLAAVGGSMRVYDIMITDPD
jgi:hypothetical protein